MRAHSVPTTGQSWIAHLSPAPAKPTGFARVRSFFGRSASADSAAAESRASRFGADADKLQRAFMKTSKTALESPDLPLPSFLARRDDPTELGVLVEAPRAGESPKPVSSTRNGAEAAADLSTVKKAKKKEKGKEKARVATSVEGEIRPASVSGEQAVPGPCDPGPSAPNGETAEMRARRRAERRERRERRAAAEASPAPEVPVHVAPERVPHDSPRYPILSQLASVARDLEAFGPGLAQSRAAGGGHERLAAAAVETVQGDVYRYALYRLAEKKAGGVVEVDRPELVKVGAVKRAARSFASVFTPAKRAAERRAAFDGDALTRAVDEILDGKRPTTIPPLLADIAPRLEVFRHRAHEELSVQGNLPSAETFRASRANYKQRIDDHFPAVRDYLLTRELPEKAAARDAESKFLQQATYRGLSLERRRDDLLRRDAALRPSGAPEPTREMLPKVRAHEFIAQFVADSRIVEEFQRTGRLPRS